MWKKVNVIIYFTVSHMRFSNGTFLKFPILVVVFDKNITGFLKTKTINGMRLDIARILFFFFNLRIECETMRVNPYRGRIFQAYKKRIKEKR